MDMKQAIQRVADRQDLTGEEAGEVMELDVYKRQV